MQILASAGGQYCSTPDYWCHWWPPVVMMGGKHVPAPSIWLIIHILSMYARTLVFITSNVSMITACDRPLLWWWLAIMCLFLPIHITGWNFLPCNVCYDLRQGHISVVNLAVGFFAVLTKILKYIYVAGKTGKYLRAALDLPVSCCIYDSMWTPVVMIGVARCLRQ